MVNITKTFQIDHYLKVTQNIHRLVEIENLVNE